MNVTPSFFERQPRTTEQQRQTPRQERSPSVKRVREDEDGDWRTVEHKRKNKPKPKAASGTADLHDFDNLAGPADFWIGNTHASTDADKMKTVLKRCAESLGVENFVTVDVRCLTKEENPRSKSWKVSVPAGFRELMSNPAMYFRGWNQRVFTYRADPRKRFDNQGAPGTVGVSGAMPAHGASAAVGISASHP